METSTPEFILITLKSGFKSLRSLQYNETFHPVTGPLAEANILHVKQQRLVERASTGKKLIIWDVGFGAAANVIAAIEALLTLSPLDVEIHSFDRTTAPIEFALAHSEELGYLAPYESHLKQLLKDKSVLLAPGLSWHLHMGDFRSEVKSSLLHSPHAVIYDPYSPVGNPDMWTEEAFTTLWQRLDPKTPCLLTNYTRSTSMRVALLLAGFYVGIGSEVGEKAETSVASNCLEMIKRPLDRKWLEARVRISHNSAPLKTALYSKSPITAEDYQRLEQHPQFAI